MGKITREDRIVIKALLVFIMKKICLKFASHHFLLYVVYMCQKSLNITYVYSNVTIKNVSWPHFSWHTLYIHTHAPVGDKTLELLRVC